MYCSNCGSDISDDVKFCPECGQPKQPKASEVLKNAEDAAAADNISEDAGENPAEDAPPAPEGKPVMKAVQAKGTENASVAAAATQPPSQGASANPEKPWYGKPWFIIVIVIAIVVAVAVSMVALGTSMDAASKMQQPSQPSQGTQAAPPASNAPDSSSASSGPAPSSSDAQAVPGSSSDAWSGIEHPNYTTKQILGFTPSVSYLASHEGDDIVEYLIGLGYRWSTSDRSFVLDHNGENVSIAALGDHGASLVEEDFLDMDRLSFTDDAEGYKVVVSPGTFDDVVNAMMEGSQTDASATSPDGESAVYLTWPGGADSIIVYAVRDSSTGTTTLYLYNDAFVLDGFLPDALDNGQTGLTASKFFDSFAQRVQSQGWRVAG